MSSKPQRMLLEKHIPRCGPCLLCGGENLDARHRLIDAIRSRASVGEAVTDLAVDYGVPSGLIDFLVSADWATIVEICEVAR